MSGKIPGLLFLFLFIATRVCCQKIIINGKESDGKLAWSDFTGKVNRNVPYFAFTAYKITPKTSNVTVHGDSISIGQIEVVLEFDPQRSWAVQEKETDELLVHEQGHFNIGILNLRDLLNTYSHTKFTKSNFSNTFHSIMTDVSKKYHEMGIRYDEETNHSVNKEQQLKWNKFLEEQLALPLTN